MLSCLHQPLFVPCCAVPMCTHSALSLLVNAQPAQGGAAASNLVKGHKRQQKCHCSATQPSTNPAPSFCRAATEVTNSSELLMVFGGARAGPRARRLRVGSSGSLWLGFGWVPPRCMPGTFGPGRTAQLGRVSAGRDARRAVCCPHSVLNSLGAGWTRRLPQGSLPPLPRPPLREHSREVLNYVSNSSHRN